LLELAKGTTVLIDEIADLLMEHQGLLLQAIDEKKIRRIGATAMHACDFRVVTATLHKIEQLVAEKKFRVDLFNRLNCHAYEVPPLRARLGDIPVIARSILRGHGCTFELTDGAINKLAEHDFPGNIRELEALLAGAEMRVAGANGERIEADHVVLPKRGDAPKAGEVTYAGLHAYLEDIERNTLLKCYADSDRNLNAALKKLPGYTYNTLRRRLVAWGALS
jgi:two-component system, NtrC family, response regulator PilR